MVLSEQEKRINGANKKHGHGCIGCLQAITATNVPKTARPSAAECVVCEGSAMYAEVDVRGREEMLKSFFIFNAYCNEGS